MFSFTIWPLCKYTEISLQNKNETHTTLIYYTDFQLSINVIFYILWNIHFLFYQSPEVLSFIILLQSTYFYNEQLNILKIFSTTYSEAEYFRFSQKNVTIAHLYFLKSSVEIIMPQYFRLKDISEGRKCLFHGFLTPSSWFRSWHFPLLVFLYRGINLPVIASA